MCRAKKTPKRATFEAEKDAQTTSKQLQNNFEKVWKMTF